MKKIKFSILIPVYNTSKYLRECLESVINQSYNNFEIILLNDGSTDNSLEICKEYSKYDERVNVFSQNNKGLILTRRRLIDLAKGDFCIFLDSDDYFEIDLLSNLNKAILKENVDLIIYKCNRVSEKSLVLLENEAVFKHNTIFTNREKGELFKKIIASSELNNLVCKAFSREIIDFTDYSKYKEIKNGEDLLQSLPIIYNAKKILYMNLPLYNYRITPGSITKKFNRNKFRDITLVRKEVLNYMIKLNIDTEENKINFYYFYASRVLNYILDLIKSDIGIKDKKNILKEINSEILFQQALNNKISLRKMNLKEKIILNLNAMYRILYLKGN
ncbi:glycosyltransferase family 2 protein [Clostridium perfringens]|nr:glycosyltransferase family 2 protein [Clostridium perfringens]